MTSHQSELGALDSLGPEQDKRDAALLLEVFRSIESWILREPELKSASNKLYAYSFGAIWSDKRAGTRVGWRLGWSAVPWSAAARALLAVDARGRIIVRAATGSRDPLSLEHVVPKGLIFTELRHLCQNGTAAEAVSFLHDNTRLAVVTKEEGKGLFAASTTTGLWRRPTMRRSALPPTEYLAEVTAASHPWQWARYLEVGHDLLSFALLREASDLDPAVRARLVSGPA